jgi:hypothetical protein
MGDEEMPEESNPQSRRKLSEQSKKLLKREVQQVENRLESEFQRPFVLRAEAEGALAKLPPWPALACVVFGAIIALIAIPSAFSYHSFTWERQQRLLTAIQSPEQIEAFPTGNNWRAVTLILPFAAIAVGLTIWGRRHKLAYLGLGLYGFAVLETALVAAVCEWSDGKERQLMAMELRIRLKETAKSTASPVGEDEEPLDDEETAALEELRYRLEEEQQQRRMADLEAVQKNNLLRMQAEKEVAEKAEKERQQQEAERKKREAQQREEAERKQKAEEQRQDLALKEMRAAELLRAQVARREQLQATQEQLDNLNASRKEAQENRDDSAQVVETTEARLKTLDDQHAQLLEQVKSQEELVRGAEQVLDRANGQRSDLTKKLKTAGMLKPSEEKALKQAENMAKASAQLRSVAQKDLRDLKSQANASQAEIRKVEADLARQKGELAKMDASLNDLDTQIGQTRAAIEELKK